MKKVNLEKLFSIFSVVALSSVMVFSSFGCNNEKPDGEGEQPTHTHKYNEDVTTMPTCTQEGLKAFTCECGDSYTEIMKTLNHTYSNHMCIVCGTVEEGKTPIIYDWVDDSAFTKDAKRVIYAANNTERRAKGTKEDPVSFDLLMRGFAELKITAGDTIIVHPGVYKLSERIRLDDNDSGTYNQNIKVVNADSENKVVLDFTQMEFGSNNRGVQIDANYHYWYGIDIMGAGDNGMYVGGSYNVIENCEFYYNRDSGLQLGRSYGVTIGDETTDKWGDIDNWPCHNLIKNCTSWGNYDNQAYGENADGFAAKLTVGYGNVFDGCIAYRNSDDGWDLYAKLDTGNIGQVIMYNCVAFENGFLPQEREIINAMFPTLQLLRQEGDPNAFIDPTPNKYMTRDGDGNGFKLGGSSMVGDVMLYNCMSYYNLLHGVTDNSNPGVISLTNVTSFDNSATVNDSTGVIVESDTRAANFNTARTNASYNNYSHCLSVSSTGIIGSDDYRGAAQYSIFFKDVEGSYRIDSAIDAESTWSEEGKDFTTKVGTPCQNVPVSVFAKLPSKEVGVGGADSQKLHSTLRNADGSINMGQILKIVDHTALLNEQKIGANLTSSNYNEYTHYDFADLSASVDGESAILTAIDKMLYINTSTFGTYQDFDLVGEIKGINISWTSSNENLVKIATEPTVSISSSKTYRAYVYRDLTADKEVTLTASFSYNGKTQSKTFTINIVKDDPGIGELYIEAELQGQSLTVLRNGDSFIVDEGDKTFIPPKLCVQNSADYNGKLLKENLQYSFETKIEYATDKNGTYTQIDAFDINKAGAYKYTHVVTLATDATKTAQIEYYVLVAATTTPIDFLGYTDESENAKEGAVVTVYRDGYMIEGDVSAPTGYIYSLSLKSSENAPTAEEIIKNGQKHSFKADHINFGFTSCTNNAQAYNVYYLLTDMDGVNKSEIYSSSITTKRITSAQSLVDTLSASTKPNVIYLVSKNLDFTGVTFNAASKKKGFEGLLNGNGYTISNLTIDNGNSDGYASMIYKLEGGTIMNFKFTNLTINSQNNKVGLVAMSYGGYVYNVHIDGYTLTGGARVGGIVGQMYEGKTYIDQVSITNANITASERVGGIVGFVQSSAAGSTKSLTMECYISNCYVDANVLSKGDYAGGIVGRFDDRNTVENNVLEVKYCIVKGSVKTVGNYCGGVVGAQSGIYTVRLYGCVSFVDLYYHTDEVVVTSQKNCSGIFGRFNLAADAKVEKCYAIIEEYNIEFDVTSNKVNNWVGGSATTAYFWNTYVGFDSQRWTLSFAENGTTVIAPYLTLNLMV